MKVMNKSQRERMESWKPRSRDSLLKAAESVIRDWDQSDQGDLTHSINALREVVDAVRLAR